MRENLSDITVVLDKSGSMATTKHDTIGGFNQFLRDQKLVPGDANFTLVLFDSEVKHGTTEPLSRAQELSSFSYWPGGNTALLDAVGSAIDRTGKRLSALPEYDRPSKVVFVIVTDGEENSSTQFTLERVKEMITHQQDVYKWQFVFLGANQDAFTSGAQLGTHHGSTMSFAQNSAGIIGAYMSSAKKLSEFRTGVSASVSFDAQDYQIQKDAGEDRNP